MENKNIVRDGIEAFFNATAFHDNIEAIGFVVLDKQGVVQVFQSDELLQDVTESALDALGCE